MKGVKGFVKGHKHTKETRIKISKALSKKIKFNCDLCGLPCEDKPSQYARKKRHFCGALCYAKYRKDVMPPCEQNSYKNGGMSVEEKKLRIKARSDLNHAIRDGILERQSCKVCGDVKSEGHHINYKNPLEVVWLCDKHHHAEHARIHQNPELLNG